MSFLLLLAAGIKHCLLATRFVMVTLSRMFPWRNALLNVKPDTLMRWHRKASGSLALEVEAIGKTAFTQQYSAAHPADGR